MKLLITGCASRLANASLPVLLNDQRVKNITGLDVKPSSMSHPRFQFHTADVRDNDLAAYFVDTDAVIHLAFIDDNGLLGRQRFDRDYIRSVNVAGTQNVTRLAAEHKIKTLICVSSAIVYGFSRDNPPFVTEDQPLQSVSNFYYAEDKVAVEQWLDEFEQHRPDMRIVRLRPHCILGQHTQPLVTALLKQPFHLVFKDPQPLLQCVSETDVAGALQRALFSDATGAFNLATDQVASLFLVQQHLHRFSPPLPYAFARHLHRIAWHYTGRYGDPGWFEGMQFSLTVANDKAKRELGWFPTLDLFDCLDATI
ncbi:MAG: NAD-dependent epimerase/dehydratase family protein [Gammaproteobacteria bacterium]|jgi:nucleoside-diphosphate-sugar epimerase